MVLIIYDRPILLESLLLFNVINELQKMMILISRGLN